MKKILLFSMLASALMILPQASKAGCNAEDIVIDGNYSDWDDCEVIVSDTAGDLSNLQYWDNNAGIWTTTNPGYDTWTFDDAAMVDITTFKMLNDQTYIYFYMKNNWPMMALKAPDGAYIPMWDIEYSEYFSGTDLSNYDFVPTSTPGFDHWMVWAFDVEQDGLYDYYFTAHLDMTEMVQTEVSQSSAEGEDDSGPGLYVYQDNGDGNFDENTDILLAIVEPNDGSTSMDDMDSDVSSLEFEIKQNIETFYEETGISYGDTVNVRMETRSTDGDVTSGSEYVFDLGAPQNLKAKPKKTKAVLKWKKNKNADQYTIRLYTKNGKLKRIIKKIKKRRKVVKKLTSGKTYKYKVRAIDKRKNRPNIKSSWSKFKKFTTKG